VKTRIQSVGKSLQEFFIALEQLTHHAFPALHKDHIRVGVRKAFSSDIGDQGIKQQLLLGGKRTLTKALRQTPELEVIKLALGYSIRLWKTSDRTW
jgi:hypothetical protein